MISDLQTIAEAAPSSPLRSAFNGQTGAVQPVANVAQYLATRTAQPHYLGEEHLLITLPATLQAEVKALVRAVHFVASLVKDKMSVQAACKQTLTVFKSQAWKFETFRPKYDTWARAKDWVVLVNRAKAPAAWKAGNVGLPEKFLQHCETKFGQFVRTDGKRQALLAIKRHWRTGRNEAGADLPVPGYEVLADGSPWKKRDRENFPAGWSYDNILTQIKKRARFTPEVRALLHEGESAAREFLPQVLGTRRGLRFLEKVTFDDLRLDWLVFNPATGRAEELWLLIARDEATAMVLGFVMHLATATADGKASHLGAQQMKELAAQLLQTYPLPPYVVHWVVERGTATLSAGVQAALGELLNHRIQVHYTSMIGARDATGYAEKAKGNSRGKASHEAHNRLFHTQGAFMDGQTGAHYGVRPASLKARCEEARQIWLDSRELPAHIREQVQYPLPTLTKAREKFQEFCVAQNFRTEHELEDFEEVLEVFADGQWQPAPPIAERGQPVPATEIGDAPAEPLRMRKRREMPVERAVRLIAAVERWDRVSPDILIAFLEHTQKWVTVGAQGEIQFDQDGVKLKFRHGGLPLAAGTKALAYFSPSDPGVLHLTTGDGRILGTWAARDRVAYLDRAALARAMRYTGAAREAAKEIARDLATPQREQLAAMREHNATLTPFVATTEAPAALGYEPGSAAARTLHAFKAVAAENQASPPVAEPEPDCTADILSDPQDAQTN